MIVADTNVIAYLYIAGDSTAAARRALARDPMWAVPLLWRSEFRNALALYVRRNDVTLDEAVSIQEEAERLLSDNEHDVPSAAILRLAARSGRTAYDCEFVALAEQLGVPLVTNDTQVLASFPETAVALADFGA